jgi:NTE family protein
MKGPIAVVTTFGLGRTPAQVGMLEELAARGIDADCVVGTSLGAFNAAALAAGRSTEQMRAFWLWFYDDVLGTPVRAVARGMTGVQARRQEAALRARIEEYLPGTFADLSTPLRLAGTQLDTGAEVHLESGSLADAVMASACLPGVFPPVEWEGTHVIDGGLVSGMPLQDVPDEAQTIIVLDTGASAVTSEVAAGYRWWEVGALAYAHLVREQAVHALVRAAAGRSVVMLSTDTGRLLDFSDPEAAMTAGREAAAEVLDRVPARPKRGIYGLPAALGEFEVLQAVVAG